MPTIAKTRRTQAERREESEARLLEAGVDLLVERGYDRFALAEIGERAGYSRGLAAHHFENKEGLLEALANHIIDGFAKGVGRHLDAASGWEAVVRGIRYHISSPRRNPTGFQAYMIILAEAALQPKLATLVVDVHNRAITGLIENIEAAKAAGDVHADCDARLTAETIYAFQRGVLTLARTETGIDVNAIGENFIAAMTAHVRSDPGKGR